MEAFSLLKYWRVGGGAPAPDPSDGQESYGTTSFVTADADDEVDSDEDGPFFDLEFAVPDEDDNASTRAENGEVAEESDEEDEFDFALSSSSGEDCTDPNLTLSPSDDLFFKGRLVTVEPASIGLGNGSEPNNSKPSRLPVSLLKSANKFRVMRFGFMKPKQSTAEEKTEPAPKKPETEEPTAEKKRFTVKFRVEEVRIMSLFTRDHSAARTSAAKQSSAAGENPSSDKRFSKEVMQKYLRKVKPLYVRVSRRYGDKLGFSGQLSLGSAAKPAPAPPETTKTAAPEKGVEASTAETEDPAPVKAKTQKQGNITTGFRVVCKHFGKSRSASSAVAAAPPAPVPSKRRDDSLLQQQDGIQGAILHCKKSFNSSGDPESSLLPRSVSDSAKDKLGGGGEPGDDESRKSSYGDGVA